MKNENNQSLPSSVLTLLPLQDFSSRETDFYSHQFLSNFFKYSSSNFLSSHLYNIFVIYFPGNSSLLKSFSSTISNFSYLLISTFILPLNSSNASLVFPKSSSFFYILCFTINLFYLTKYFSILLIFLLFKIFFTSHSSTPFIIGLPSFCFYSPTCFLYCTI